MPDPTKAPSHVDLPNSAHSARLPLNTRSPSFILVDLPPNELCDPFQPFHRSNSIETFLAARPLLCPLKAQSCVTTEPTISLIFSADSCSGAAHIQLPVLTPLPHRRLRRPSRRLPRRLRFAGSCTVPPFFWIPVAEKRSQKIVHPVPRNGRVRCLSQDCRTMDFWWTTADTNHWYCTRRPQESV